MGDPRSPNGLPVASTTACDALITRVQFEAYPWNELVKSRLIILK